jgi:hypothetical protein
MGLLFSAPPLGSPICVLLAERVRLGKFAKLSQGRLARLEASGCEGWRSAMKAVRASELARLEASFAPGIRTSIAVNSAAALWYKRMAVRTVSGISSGWLWL